MSKANQKIQTFEKDQVELHGMSVHHLSAQYQKYPDAHFEIDTWYEDTTIYVRYDRIETDEEFEARLITEKEDRKLHRQQTVQKRKQQKEKDLKEFNRLKEKYGL